MCVGGDPKGVAKVYERRRAHDIGIAPPITVRVSPRATDHDFDTHREPAPDLENLLNSGRIQPGMNSGQGHHPCVKLFSGPSDLRCGQIRSQEANLPSFVGRYDAREQRAELVALTRGGCR